MHLYESAENYLERILIISNREGSVRSIDIVNDMGFKKSSVSVAMKQLRESGHITVDDSGLIALTDTGRAVAERMLERHTLLRDLLVSIGVDPETAELDACKIEHDLSAETFKKIQAYVEKK